MTTTEILTHYGLEPIPATVGTDSLQPTILYRTLDHVHSWPWNKKLGITLIILALGALFAAYSPILTLEASYQLALLSQKLNQQLRSLEGTLTSKVPNLQLTTYNLQLSPSPFPDVAEFNPLIDAYRNPIKPVNNNFALIVPKVGINAPVVAGVSPVSTAGYNEALKKGVAHSSTSFYPDENGTVYLFSHSTNYEWFIKDLNAVFYYLKNIGDGDLIVLMYQGNRYTYKIREKKIVSPREISYLVPQAGVRSLILQTCYPPGTVYKRLLIFSDLIEVKHYGTFREIDI